jgi:hypothetical protein
MRDGTKKLNLNLTTISMVGTRIWIWVGIFVLMGITIPNGSNFVKADPYYATFSETVCDGSGSPQSNVVITIKNQRTNEQIQVQTDQYGEAYYDTDDFLQGVQDLDTLEVTHTSCRHYWYIHDIIKGYDGGVNVDTLITCSQDSYGKLGDFYFDIHLDNNGNMRESYFHVKNAQTTNSGLVLGYGGAYHLQIDRANENKITGQINSRYNNDYTCDGPGCTPLSEIGPGTAPTYTAGGAWRDPVQADTYTRITVSGSGATGGTGCTATINLAIQVTSDFETYTTFEKSFTAGMQFYNILP